MRWLLFDRSADPEELRDLSLRSLGYIR